MKKVLLIIALLLTGILTAQNPANFPRGIRLPTLPDVTTLVDSNTLPVITTADGTLRDITLANLRTAIGTGSGITTASQGLSVSGSDVRLGGSNINTEVSIPIVGTSNEEESLTISTTTSESSITSSTTFAPDSFGIIYRDNTVPALGRFTLTQNSVNISARNNDPTSSLVLNSTGATLRSVSTATATNDSQISASTTAIKLNSPSIGTPVVGQPLVFTNADGTIGQSSTIPTGTANGLSLISGNAELGGTITKTTSIALGTNNFTITSGAGNMQFFPGLDIFEINNYATATFNAETGGTVNLGTTNSTVNIGGASAGTVNLRGQTTTLNPGSLTPVAGNYISFTDGSGTLGQTPPPILSTVVTLTDQDFTNGSGVELISEPSSGQFYLIVDVQITTNITTAYGSDISFTIKNNSIDVTDNFTMNINSTGSKYVIPNRPTSHVNATIPAPGNEESVELMPGATDTAGVGTIRIEIFYKLITL